MRRGLLGDLFGDTGDESAQFQPAAPPGNYYTDAATVRAVQTALKGSGVDPGPIDGKFGPRTFAAVERFNHTPGDGYIDDVVLENLGVRPGQSSPSSGRPASSPRP